jgi:hypothetical protein
MKAAQPLRGSNAFARVSAALEPVTYPLNIH